MKHYEKEAYLDLGQKLQVSQSMRKGLTKNGDNYWLDRIKAEQGTRFLTIFASNPNEVQGDFQAYIVKSIDSITFKCRKVGEQFRDEVSVYATIQPIIGAAYFDSASSVSDDELPFN